MTVLANLLTVGLIFSTCYFVGAVAVLVLEHQSSQGVEIRGAWAIAGLSGAAALGTWPTAAQSWELLVPLCACLAVSLAARRFMQNFTVAGQLFLAAHVPLLLFGLLWGTWFVLTIPISPLTRGLMLAGVPLLVLGLPAGLVQTLEGLEVLCRRHWTRPREPLPILPRSHYPKVSVHLPACSEPPEIVIATLDTLARLRYPNFEVLVIDNNTTDPSLWRPVEAHCRRLGERFRFFHVEALAGAKAGAVNFALRHAAPDAELVAIVDADYQVEPDFLASLVGYFDDPQIGFVQTPHDYRGWEGSLYQRMCYWEYRYFHLTTMVSLNERNAGITVGTMCLIRRTALERAGGWAEWCLTEDSELAIRIHALGYSSVYVPVTYGRGLIPETFIGYKRQRFRWVYGPVQELKQHLRLYLPRRLGQPSALSPAQKIEHLNHGLENASPGLGLLLTPLGLATAGSLLLQHEDVPLPPVLWLLAAVGLAGGLALTWLAYRVVLSCSLVDFLGAVVAGKALGHTRMLASARCFFTASIPWQRTSKFKALPLGLGALGWARAELCIGVALVLLGGSGFIALRPSGLLLLLLVGLLAQGLNYLAAPMLALLGEWELRPKRVSEELTVFPDAEASVA
jgi:hypothetical protein